MPKCHRDRPQHPEHYLCDYKNNSCSDSFQNHGLH